MLRGIWTLVVLVVSTAVFALPLALINVINPRWSNITMHAGRVWSSIMLAAVGARVRFHGLERATEHHPCIFIANHESYIDVWVMFHIVPPSTRFVAKRELFRIPLLGWAMAASGTVAIDRRNRTEAIRSLRQAAERIRGGHSVVLFPEGSRSRDGEMRPFKKGAFHLALQAGVPIVPIAICGSYEVLPPKLFRGRPGPVDVYLERPVDVTPYAPDDYAGLLREVESVIKRRVGEPEYDAGDGAVQLETP